MKKVLLEPAGRTHSYLLEMALHPPSGYEFILDQPASGTLLSPLIRSDLIYFCLQRNVINRLAPVPVRLAKAYLEGFLKKRPPGVDLTYSFGHLVFRREPWVVELEWIHQLTGFSYAHLCRFRRLVEKVLTSRECKRIICWCELARDSIFAHLDSHTLRDKVEVVPHAVPPKAFTKRFDEHKIRLLFVGSGNIPGEFYSKGGNVVLEAFARLKQRYGNLELVMRSDVPPRIKKRYQGISGLRIIEDKLSKEELEREFLSADIFLFPGHQTPFMVLLEAMSYELPVIATDVYANREIVQDGRTGFLIPAASHVRYYVAELLPTGTGDWLGGRLKKDVQRLDPQMVANVVEKTAVLIESPGLRRRLGEAGRWEVEAGKFSLERRNEKLKAIFDEATEGESRMSST